jgi:hypothetical protein
MKLDENHIELLQFPMSHLDKSLFIPEGLNT